MTTSSNLTLTVSTRIFRASWSSCAQLGEASHRMGTPERRRGEECSSLRASRRTAAGEQRRASRTRTTTTRRRRRRRRDRSCRCLHLHQRGHEEEEREARPRPIERSSHHPLGFPGREEGSNRVRGERPDRAAKGTLAVTEVVLRAVMGAVGAKGAEGPVVAEDYDPLQVRFEAPVRFEASVTQLLPLRCHDE